MNLLKLIPLFFFFSACHSGPQQTGAWRKPSSSKTTELTIPVSDIVSIITAEGTTACLKKSNQNRGRAGMIYFFDCVTVIPYSFHVKSSTLGVDKIFYSVSTEVYKNIPSKTDISINPVTLNNENEQTFSTYLSDVARGCYGASIDITIQQEGTKEEVQFVHSAYFGSARCKLVKAASSTKTFAIASYKSVANTTKDIAVATKDHAVKVAQSIDAWQEDARQRAANGLKNLGEAIAPN